MQNYSEKNTHKAAQLEQPWGAGARGTPPVSLHLRPGEDGHSVRDGKICAETTLAQPRAPQGGCNALLLIPE